MILTFSFATSSIHLGELELRFFRHVVMNYYKINIFSFLSIQIEISRCIYFEQWKSMLSP